MASMVVHDEESKEAVQDSNNACVCVCVYVCMCGNIDRKSLEPGGGIFGSTRTIDCVILCYVM